MQHTSTHIGFIGLGTMGSNLVKNFVSKGIAVSIFNRTKSKTHELADQIDNSNLLFPHYSIQEFIQSLPTPRIIHLVVSSSAVDEVLEEILECGLEKGDIIVDLGNSNWKDTEARQILCEKESVYLVGCGMSGGAQGALQGPSLMPGGTKEAVDRLLPIYEHIAAKDFNGNPCVTNIGSSGSGHFVKMVHNGIEYALMQVIAELYGYLSDNNYTKAEILDVFQDINATNMESFLLEITCSILSTMEESSYLLDQIDPQAQGKGTGKWTVESALELGVPIPTIAAAVFQRFASTNNGLLDISTELDLVVSKDEMPVTSFDLTQALTTVFKLVYLQGFELIARADKEHSWGIELPEVIRIWQGGCIIRSKLLTTILQDLKDTTLFDGMKDALSLSQQAFTPIPAIRATLDYGLTLTSNLNEMALIQAQRDYFGQHGYRLRGTDTTVTGGWDK